MNHNLVTVLGETREISGRTHNLVERGDGFRFYLDPVFLYALEHSDDSDLTHKLVKMGAAEDEVPLILEEASLGDYLVERLDLGDAKPGELDSWRDVVEDIRRPKQAVRIGLVGKYVELRDAYLSVREALHHAGLRHNVDVDRTL